MLECMESEEKSSSVSLELVFQEIVKLVPTKMTRPITATPLRGYIFHYSIPPPFQSSDCRLPMQGQIQEF